MEEDVASQKRRILYILPIIQDVFININKSPQSFSSLFLKLLSFSIENPSIHIVAPKIELEQKPAN